MRNGIELIKGLHSHYDFFPESKFKFFSFSRKQNEKKGVERGNKKPCTFARKHFLEYFPSLKLNNLVEGRVSGFLFLAEGMDEEEG